LDIDLYLNRAELQSVKLNKNQVAVVIDVLRASTTIITAIGNGCDAIIPVAEVEQAREEAQKRPGQNILVCGERDGMLIPGFDLSNSPFEYTPEIVKGKCIIFTSTNGSQLFSYSRQAGETIVCGFVNISSVCEHLKNSDKNVAILCAGINGQFGLEDAVCGGGIIDKLSRNKNDSLQLNDGAVAALVLYQKFSKNIVEMLYQSSHGKRLIKIGQEKDLVNCASIDLINIVPILRGEEIITSNRKD